MKPHVNIGTIGHRSPSLALVASALGLMGAMQANTMHPISRHKATPEPLPLSQDDLARIEAAEAKRARKAQRKSQ